MNKNNRPNQKKLRLIVPELLKQRGVNPQDLMWGARIAQGTAYHLANGKAERISFDVLSALCSYFECGVGDLFVLE
jgi:DNA-binding Xre family transcriptional regulator